MDLPDPLASAACARLAEELRRRAPTPGRHDTRHPRLSLLHQVRRTARAPVVYDPCLCVVVQGCKLAHLGTQVYRYDPLQFLVLSVPLALECEIVEASATRPYLGLKLDLDAALLSTLLLQMEEDAAPPDDELGAPGVEVSPTAPELCDALVRLVRALDDGASARVLAPLAEREVLFHALRSTQGGVLRRLAYRDGATGRIGRVLRHVQEHLEEPLEVAGMARLASMSASAFHEHFRAVTSDSPLQYVKKLRLHRARRLMLHDGLGAAEAAFRVGYQSPSQFSREFKRLFGATPRREVARSRGTQGDD